MTNHSSCVVGTTLTTVQLGNISEPWPSLRGAKMFWTEIDVGSPGRSGDVRRVLIVRPDQIKFLIRIHRQVRHHHHRLRLCLPKWFLIIGGPLYGGRNFTQLPGANVLWTANCGTRGVCVYLRTAN